LKFRKLEVWYSLKERGSLYEISDTLGFVQVEGEVKKHWKGFVD
jgi:hypothetical protein